MEIPEIEFLRDDDFVAIVRLRAKIYEAIISEIDNDNGEVAYPDKHQLVEWVCGWGGNNFEEIDVLEVVESIIAETRYQRSLDGP